LWRRLMWHWRRRARGGKRPELDSADAIVRRFRLVPPETYLSNEALARLALLCAEPLPNGKWAFRFDPETRGWRRITRAMPKPKLRRISVPTLILRGAESTLISPRAMRAMHRRVRSSIALEIPRAYHHVPLDNPDATAAAVAALLETLAPDSGS
jgi:pimeloyl-ACP methyl ester carboxylesterase